MNFGTAALSQLDALWFFAEILERPPTVDIFLSELLFTEPALGKTFILFTGKANVVWAYLALQAEGFSTNLTVDFIL